jgi:hypothetical protein
MSNGRSIVNYNLERVQKEVVVTHFEVLFQYLPESIDDDNEKLKSR